MSNGDPDVGSGLLCVSEMSIWLSITAACFERSENERTS